MVLSRGIDKFGETVQDVPAGSAGWLPSEWLLVL